MIVVYKRYSNPAVLNVSRASGARPVRSMLALAAAANTHGWIVVGRRRRQGVERVQRRLSFLNKFVREEHKTNELTDGLTTNGGTRIVYENCN